MNVICKEFEERIKNEEVTGTCKWIKSEEYEWEDRKTLNDYISTISTQNFTRKQYLILRFVTMSYVSITRIKDLKIDLPLLDEEDVKELLVYYDLENPIQKYKEIKAEIAAPTSYLTRIPYKVIYELYKRGKVPLDRQIFAACLVRFNVWHASSYSKNLTKEASEKFASFFPKDDFTLDILMAVFEMELGVDGAFYMEREFNIGAMIIELVNTNHISREVIQQKLFDAFNNPILKQTTHGWSKNIYRDLLFSIEENIDFQNQLIQLLYNDRNLLVNFGLQQLKKLTNTSSFNWNLFINSLDGIVYREKLTGGLKIALGMLCKGIKKNNSLIKPTCIQLAPIFLQEDNTLQIAAKKIFDLLKEKNEDVKEALIPFVDTMHTEVKSSLSHLLDDSLTTKSVFYTPYKEEEYIQKPCVNKNKIAYIANEDDFIFLVSKVLKSNNALDYELFLESLLRYSYLKETHLQKLKPALKQAKKIAEEQYLEITARVGVHHLVVAKLICMWLSSNPYTVEIELESLKELVKSDERYSYTANRWFSIFSQFKRVSYISEQIHSKKVVLPLLSTPTHTNFEIEGTIFFKRLEVYEVAKKQPDETDFCMAISRLNKSAIFNLKPTSEYHDILSYLLDEKAIFNKKKIKKSPSIWFTAYMLKNPEEAISILITKYKKENWLEPVSSIWNWELGHRYSEEGKYSWATLKMDFEQPYEVSKTVFLKNSYFEHYLTNQEFIIADVHHWFLRDGMLQEPLFFNLILRAYKYLSDMEANESKSVLEVVKYNAQYPLPLKKAGVLFLTLSLFNGKSPIRSAAFDWLSILIENNYLNLEEFTTTVSKMVANKHHPIPMVRVIEQFDRLLQIQDVYVDVLYKTIETILVDIDVNNLPKSFSKVLHHYYEVLQIVQKPIPNKILISLQQLQKINAVKKQVKKLLEI